MAENNNYFTYTAFQLNQITNKLILIAKVPFIELIEVVKFTAREPLNYDPFDPYKNALSVANDLVEQYYQRLLNDKRTKSIEEFLVSEINNIINGHHNKAPLGSFPTSMILAIDQLDDVYDIKKFEEFITQVIKESNEDDGEITIGAYLEKITDCECAEPFYKLLVPKLKSALVVDGQHRLAGIKRLYDNAKNKKIYIGRKSLNETFNSLTYDDIINQINKFELNCTFLIDYDRWEQGKIFADVNFNQKSVNKSIYYDIFGSYPDPDHNDIYLAHNITMHLNNNDNSVLKNKIKMLGTGDGLISQAFFVENILPLFLKNNVWGDLPYDYINGGEKHKFLPKFFNAYFTSIKFIFQEYWPKDFENTSRKYKSILLKTTGMGALLRLIEDVYKHLNSTVDFVNDDESKIISEFNTLFEVIENNGEEYFSENSTFSGSGSRGSQVRLYKMIKKDLKLY